MYIPGTPYRVGISTHVISSHRTTCISGPVFTKILRIFLRITLKSKKNSMLRIFLFLEKILLTKQFLAKNNSKNGSKKKCVHRLD